MTRRNEGGAPLPPYPAEFEGVKLMENSGQVGTIFDRGHTICTGVFVRWMTEPAVGVPPIPVIKVFDNTRALDDFIRLLRKHRMNVWG